MKILKREQLVYTNNLSVNEKELVCKKLNRIYKGNQFRYSDIDIVKDLIIAISNGEILGEKDINQVNYLLKSKLRIRFW
ncbi:MAG: hypothetical protein H2212_03635 [Ruminococcus sp.]|nr:hypothetical protein [Ruminococcus sp.]